MNVKNETGEHAEGNEQKPEGNDPANPEPGNAPEPKEGEGQQPVNPADLPLEELEKLNPHVAEILKERRDAEAKRQEEEETRRKEEQQRQEKQGEFQKLYEQQKNDNETLRQELKKQKEISEKYATSVEGMVNEMLKSIPEDNRALIPSDFSPRQKLEYITANAKRLGVKMTGGGDGPIDRNDGAPAMTQEQELLKEISELQEKGKGGTLSRTEQDILWEKSKQLKQLRAQKSQS